jgi:hypothetical protein
MTKKSYTLGRGTVTFPDFQQVRRPELVTLDDAMQDWRRVVLTTQPTANADYVRTVCEEVVRRAQILSGQNRLRFPEVVAFLLMRSRAWVFGGLPVSKIGEKMPKTIHDLGMMKIAEGGSTGGPLDEADLTAARARSVHKIIQ